MFRARFRPWIGFGGFLIPCRGPPAPPFPHEPLLSPEYFRAGLGSLIEPTKDQPNFPHLRDMVSSTKGYYARDYSVWLGWNNMRYIIEGSALHARLLNRTLVIPSYVFVRSCESQRPACEGFATMIDRDELSINRDGDEQEDEHPPPHQMGWLIPIEVMVDLANMRKHVPVLTISQYLTLNGLSTDLETRNGLWDRINYHSSTVNRTSPSLAVVPNKEFDHDLELLRVDTLPENLATSPKLDAHASRIHDDILYQMKLSRTIGMEDVSGYLHKATGERWGQSDLHEMSTILAKYGLAPVHTFAGLPAEFSKAVNNPVTEAAPIELMRGFANDFARYTEDVLLVEGEIHSNRKPGFMAFASAEARDAYQNLVLKGIVHPPAIQALANAVADHMIAMNCGRAWMAAHWRRGDFVELGWNHNRSSHEGVDMLRSRLKSGRETLKSLKAEAKGRPTHPLPLPHDRWYLATDERNPDALAYARSKNAVLFSDVLASIPALRRLVGWPLLFTDVIALVEQEVMARSDFFFGYAFSSVAGGVVNIRAGRGMDPRAMLLDGT
ncbi:hypothetical protein DL93DRAFT_2051313 [Clavulina sp. PMI_390]|nr:hypothetical protein DL93DRAFT_2051313 [Clavulina sp. PMI_390]